ncbi:MAG: M23 family metallopeptidase, partial [Oscillospiraceae bacterium]
SVAGNYIRIETNDTLQSFYGHSQFLFVKPGDKILKGQVIASVGQSGMATGPHLHFEVIYNGRRVNPIYAIE